MQRVRFVLAGIFVVILILTGMACACAETIILKSGEKIEGKIVEKTDQYVKVEINGETSTYFADDIDKIEVDQQMQEGEVVTPEAPKADNLDILKEAFQQMRNKEYQSAIGALNKAAKTDPNNPEIYTLAGIIYNYLGQYQDAVASFEKVADLQSNSPDLYVLLGITYRSAGDEDKAKASFLKAVELYSTEDELNPVRIFITETLLRK